MGEVLRLINPQLQSSVYVCVLVCVCVLLCVCVCEYFSVCFYPKHTADHHSNSAVTQQTKPDNHNGAPRRHRHQLHYKVPVCFYSLVNSLWNCYATSYKVAARSYKQTWDQAITNNCVYSTSLSMLTSAQSTNPLI